MEIRLHGPGEPAVAVAVTMRTPGNDFELAVGFLHAEGLLRSADELATVAYCLGPEGEQEYNVVTVTTRGPSAAAVTERPFVASASCGVCGKQTLDEIEVSCGRVESTLHMDAAVLASLPERIAAAQRVFGETGGLHAAARVRADGDLVALREDVGRHNAVDKLVGQALMERALPLDRDVLVVSGRVSFEIVQKAALAGIGVIAAVSAPSSLAISAADRLGVTLAGFVRNGRANLYTHPERITP